MLYEKCSSEKNCQNKIDNFLKFPKFSALSLILIKIFDISSQIGFKN